MVVKHAVQILVLFTQKDGSDITTSMILLGTTMLKSTKTIIKQKQEQTQKHKHNNKLLNYIQKTRQLQRFALSFLDETTMVSSGLFFRLSFLQLLLLSSLKLPRLALARS